jgi:hypothetical protein
VSNRALKAGFAAVILVAAARIAPANRTPALNSGVNVGFGSKASI